MTLQDYTTEELRAELKRRADLANAEKAVVNIISATNPLNLPVSILNRLIMIK